MWGTGASSTQCEGAAPASDWWDWERAGRAPLSGDGNGFATRYAEDFALLAALGLTHHRLSIEWARIEPEPGEHDAAAVEHYRDVLTAARDAGVAPWVCLHHFTLPRWFADAGGFLSTPTAPAPGRATSTSSPRRSATSSPAGSRSTRPTTTPRRVRRKRMAARTRRLRRAGAGRRNDPARQRRGRGAAAPDRRAGVVDLRALGDRRPGRRARDRLARRAPLRTLWAPGIGLFRDGVLRVPGRDPVERPDLAGAFDLIGFSYYATMGAQRGAAVPSILPTPTARRSATASGADGLGLVLDRLHEELPGTPLLVAEYGIGTDDDDRARRVPATRPRDRRTTRRRAASTSAGSSTGPPSTTTSGSTASTSRSASSTATATSDPAPRC